MAATGQFSYNDTSGSFLGFPQDAVDVELCERLEKELLHPDYEVEDHTGNTCSIVVTVHNGDLYNELYSKLSDEYVNNSRPSENELIIKTDYENKNVVITLYDTTRRMHIQGTGYKDWWKSVGYGILEPDCHIFDSMDCHTMETNPTTSTPMTYVNNSCTYAKELISPCVNTAPAVPALINTSSVESQPCVTTSDLIKIMQAQQDTINLLLEENHKLQSLNNDLKEKANNHDLSVIRAKLKLKETIFNKSRSSTDLPKVCNKEVQCNIKNCSNKTEIATQTQPIPAKRKVTVGNSPVISSESSDTIPKSVAGYRDAVVAGTRELQQPKPQSHPPRDRIPSGNAASRTEVMNNADKSRTLLIGSSLLR